MKLGFAPRAVGRILKISIIFVCAVLPTGQAGAVGLDEGVVQLERDWESIRYETAAADREKRLEALTTTAHKLTIANPGRAEPLAWEGIVTSSLAGEKSGLGALALVKQAKGLLEESIRIDSTALEGTALNSLGVLYYKVPAWPVGFGDKSKAAELLLKSLAISPHGVDANFFYGEFLVESGHPEEAIPFLERALNVPLRPDRQMADAGRREEIRQLLAKARHH